MEHRHWAQDNWARDDWAPAIGPRQLSPGQLSPRQLGPQTIEPTTIEPKTIEPGKNWDSRHNKDLTFIMSASQFFLGSIVLSSIICGPNCRGPTVGPRFKIY